MAITDCKAEHRVLLDLIVLFLFLHKLISASPKLRNISVREIFVLCTTLAASNEISCIQKFAAQLLQEILGGVADPSVICAAAISDEYQDVASKTYVKYKQQYDSIVADKSRVSPWLVVQVDESYNIHIVHAIKMYMQRQSDCFKYFSTEHFLAFTFILPILQYVEVGLPAIYADIFTNEQFKIATAYLLLDLAAALKHASFKF